MSRALGLLAFPLALTLSFTLAAGVSRAQDNALTVPERALFQAAQQDDEDLAVFAIERGANLEAEGPRGVTPLIFAARFGSLKVIELLLGAGANPAAVTADVGRTALHFAAYDGHAAVIQRLIAAGTPPNAQESRYGNTALHLAAKQGQHAAAVALIEGGADMEIHDTADGNTPLITAAFEPLGLSVLAELIERGADLGAASHDGSTALHAASAVGHLAAIDLLLAAGADPEPLDAIGLTPLIRAAANGHSAAMARLIEVGQSSLDHQGKEGDTALGQAALGGHLDSVALLLERGANPNTVGRQGYPPLLQAVRAGALPIVAALLDAGADPNGSQLKTGNSALMLAANNGYLDIVRLLLARGASVELRAEDGWTALAAAEMIGDEAIIAVLRDAGARE